MNILIAGASGLIGQALVNYLKADHDITVLGRNLEKLKKIFPKNIKKITWQDLPKTSAKPFLLIINLSGSNIGEKRWTLSVKKTLIESRVKSNQTLITWLIENQHTPRFFSANAVGIYGLQNIQDKMSLDESTPIDTTKPKDFLQEIGVCWEASLAPAMTAKMQVTTLRFGVVLKKNEGMLKKLYPSFHWGLGSILGNGEQTISWVHYLDLIHAISFLIAHPSITGPVNITSPNPVTQKKFAECFATILHRPLWLRMPSMIVTILFGEMGQCLLLNGQRVLPSRLLTEGFKFHYPTIDNALKKEYSQDPSKG